MRLAITILLAPLAFAQTPPAIEAATVKLNASGDPGVDQQIDPVRIRLHNAPLRIVIRAAFDIKNYQLIGLPGWADSDRWDVVAAATAPATERQIFDLLQGVLAERFKLQSHWETRELPQYRLSIAKVGLKMKVFDEKNSGDGKPPVRVSSGMMEGHGATLLQFRNLLSGSLGKPVVDDTGLTGRYDFELEWAQDERQSDTRPSIFTALQELGLKLDAMKGPGQVLVIDHVEKPVVE